MFLLFVPGTNKKMFLKQQYNILGHFNFSGSLEGQQSISYLRPYCKSFCHRLVLLGHEASNKITGQVIMKIFLVNIAWKYSNVIFKFVFFVWVFEERVLCFSQLCVPVHLDGTHSSCYWGDSCKLLRLAFLMDW